MLSCNTTIPVLNLPFQRFLKFVCNFIRVSMYRATFIIVPLGIHLTKMDTEASKMSINVTFPSDVFDLVFVAHDEILCFYVNGDCFLIGM